MRKSSGQRFGAIHRFGLIGLALCGVLALPVAVAQASDTWTGASSSQWSDAGNWTAGVPTGAAGTLTFPDCAAPPNCYSTQDGVSGIAASGLVFSNTGSGSQYVIQNGQTLTVGAGGITDTPGHGTSVLIQTPLALSGGQNWRVGAAGDYNSLNLTGGVTGSSSAVAVGFPPLGSGALYVVRDMEVGPVTVDGLGGLHIGGPPTSGHPGTINATDGNPTTITNGASLVANPGSRIGPLNITGGTLLLGTNPHNNVATTLAVSGTAAIDTQSTTTTFINNNGSTPGSDFSQLSASGDITLAGQLNLRQGPVGPTNSGCASLSSGDVATLFTTSGTLTGTFANAPQDGLLTLTACGSSTAPQVRIHYSNNSVTATVVSGATTTTTTLAPPDPSPATTNQPVSLTAVVTTPADSPAGTVTFRAAGSAIPGCSGQPVNANGSSATATCTASFAAADSPVALTASFTGATGSGQTSSTSPAQVLTVAPGASSTVLAASDSSPAPAAVVTYTVTVTPADPGATTPSGTVRFSDGGPAIPDCGNRPLTAGPSGSASATCTVSYAGAGSHSITATYGGDANFGGSSSPVTAVIVAVPGSPAAVSSGPTPTPSTPTPSTPTPSTSTPSTSTQSTSTSPSSTSHPPTTRSHSSTPSRAIIATTSPATSLGTTKVTLRGRITAGGSGVRWRFLYGRSAAYGRATKFRTITGRHGTVTVSVALRRLSPHVRYHYRLEVSPVSHGARTRSGSGLTFTTRATGRLTGPAHQLTFTGQTIVVRHRCESAVPCAGRLTLATTIPRIRPARRATVVCAHGEVRIAAHRRARTTLRLTAKCLSLVRAQSRHSLSVTDTVQPMTGQLELRRRITLVLRQSKLPPVARRKLTQS